MIGMRAGRMERSKGVKRNNLKQSQVIDFDKGPDKGLLKGLLF